MHVFLVIFKRLKAVFHYATFFDRIEISLCFMSSRAELIIKRQREISFRSKNSASWNQALRFHVDFVKYVCARRLLHQDNTLEYMDKPAWPFVSAGILMKVLAYMTWSGFGHHRQSNVLSKVYFWRFRKIGITEFFALRVDCNTMTGKMLRSPCW
jgi:hypothetical protein